MIYKLFKLTILLSLLLDFSSELGLYSIYFHPKIIEKNTIILSVKPAQMLPTGFNQIMKFSDCTYPCFPHTNINQLASLTNTGVITTSNINLPLIKKQLFTVSHSTRNLLIEETWAESSPLSKVPLTTTIVITFSEMIDFNTVTSSTLVIQGHQQGLIKSKFINAFDGYSVMIKPDKAFFVGERINIVTTSAIQTTSGAPLMPHQWQFKAKGKPQRCFRGFIEVETNLFPSNGGSSIWGDYDNDGDLDILLTGYNNSQVATKVYRNDDGIFNDINANITSTFSGKALWGDYDNDSDLDILLTGNANSIYDGVPIAKIYRNEQNIFIDTQALLIPIQNSTGSWGDYDNDGDLDIVLAGNTDTNWFDPKSVTHIYRNNKGNFQAINTKLQGISFGSVAWHDYDNDGDLDLILSGQIEATKSATKIYRNSNGIFEDVPVNIPGFVGGSQDWGDYDHDGDFDLLFAGANQKSNQTAIYRNDNGNFTTIDVPLAAGQTSRWGDYDNDGDLDIFLSGIGGYTSGWIPLPNTKLYKNQADHFSNEKTSFLNFFGHSSDWGDYDNDGDLDILITGADGDLKSLTKLYQNVDCIKNDEEISHP